MIGRLLSRTALAASLFAASYPAAARAGEQPRQAVFIVIENGDTVEDQEGITTTVRHLLGQLTELRRRRATRHTEISIVLTANPTSVSWSGTPAQLMEQAGLLMEQVRFHATCSDLVLAWEQVETTLRITAPAEYRLYSVGPGIHAGYPCEDEQTITLPQTVPEMDLAGLAAEASVFKMFNLHPDQDEMFLAYSEQAGILTRAAEGLIDFDLLDTARTRAQLEDLL